jgi:CRISPR/Cas system CMR-associated protein Cmr5 small subunit
MFDFQPVPVLLNRFFVKKLTKVDRTIYEYQCDFEQNPERGKEQGAISNICYKLGVPAVRLGNKIITKEPVNESRFQGEGWSVNFLSKRILNCSNPAERNGIEQLERKILQKNLGARWRNTSIERASEGGLIWWVIGKEGTEIYGAGWEVHKGRRIDVSVDAEAALYLEIDLYHRFYTSWTLHQWQDKYPEIPISYVRNTYKDKNNQYITWKYESVGEQKPEELTIEGLGITLADYHRKIGAKEEEIKNSRVVYVKRNRKQQLTSHLSCRLSPCLTMEMLANIAEQPNLESKEKENVRKVFDYIAILNDYRSRSVALNFGKIKFLSLCKKLK